jgi:small subunit ribosomal protein S6
VGEKEISRSPTPSLPTFSLLADLQSAGFIIHKEETLRTYEVSFIVNPNTTDEELKKLTGQLEQIITDQGGKITKTDHQGRRKLAYRIGKLDEGNYTFLFLEGSGREISEVERRLRVNDAVIRYMTVRTDEDLKRAEKMKSKRRGAAAPRRAEDDLADLGLNEEERAALEEM